MRYKGLLNFNLLLLVIINVIGIVDGYADVLPIIILNGGLIVICMWYKKLIEISKDN